MSLTGSVATVKPPAAIAAKSPDSAPDQVFLGDTRGQSFGPPKTLPPKNAAISVAQTTTRMKRIATQPDGSACLSRMRAAHGTVT